MIYDSFAKIRINKDVYLFLSRKFYGFAKECNKELGITQNNFGFMKIVVFDSGKGKEV